MPPTSSTVDLPAPDDPRMIAKLAAFDARTHIVVGGDCDVADMVALEAVHHFDICHRRPLPNAFH